MADIAKILGPDGKTLATAPDQTWTARDNPWPTIGELVEVCWSSRLKTPPKYTYGYAVLIKRLHHDGATACYTSIWNNEVGDNLAFNPDFWREAR